MPLLKRTKTAWNIANRATTRESTIMTHVDDQYRLFQMPCTCRPQHFQNNHIPEDLNGVLPAGVSHVKFGLGRF